MIKMRFDRLSSHVRWIITTARSIMRWRRQLNPWVAPSDRGRLRVLCIGLVARLAHLPMPLPSFGLTIHGARHDVRVGNHHELAGAVEVLCTADYDVPVESGAVRRVIDLGANAGFATMLFASSYPDAEVVALEPAPDTYERLCHNVRGLSNVRLLQLAAGEPGTIRLNLDAPSTERSGREGAAGGVQIRRVSLSELLIQLEWSHVDVLKIDIEGDEFGLFRDGAITKARFIVGEIYTKLAPRDFPGVAAALPQFDVTQTASDEDDFPMFQAIRR